MNTEQRGNMSISDEEVFSIISQIDDTITELTDLTKSVHTAVEEEDMKTDGKSSYIHAISTSMEKQVKKVQGLSELMAEIRSFLNKYAATANEANDASMFNTED